MIRGPENPAFFQNLQAIGPRFPFENYLELDSGSYTLISNRPSIGDTLDHLSGLFNTGALSSYAPSQKEKLTPESAIKASDRFAKPYIRWQAVRHMAVPDYKLTGFEPYEIDREIFGTVNNPTAIAVAIAKKGLLFQTQEPSLTKDLLEKGLNKLTYHQLQKIDDILGGWVRMARAAMTSEGQAYQKTIYEAVEKLPNEFQQIYYTVNSHSKEVHQMFVVPRLPMHPALKKAGDLEEFIRKHNVEGFEAEQNPMVGRLIIKLVSQCGSPLARVFTGNPSIG